MPTRKFSFAVTVALAMFVASSIMIAVRAQAQTETVLHNFGNGKDGAAPYASLTRDSAGNLYGTTTSGGSGSCTPVYGSTTVPCGAVFELSPQPGGGWTEHVLYSFQGQDGYQPAADLTLDAAGNLYGTTAEGGTGKCVPYKQGNAVGCGVVFELIPSASGVWTEKVLLDFKVDGTTGIGPSGGLVFDAAGNLYGTTGGGGAHSDGTVFELSPTSGANWNETVLYSFHYEDGANPISTPVFFGGNLYGIAAWGGQHGAGVVFELIPQTGGWEEKVLHEFCSQAQCADGAGPSGDLIVDAAGNLYGTTSSGGHGVGCYGCGTAFELTPGAHGSWTETVLHNFGAHGDGLSTSGGLIFDAAWNLYGLTPYGGTHNWGTVFELSPQADGTWSESVLYSFHLGTENDGGVPVGRLVIDASGNLYGSTTSGGMYSAGTVFEITR
jgi:uncharacterized repeat protein (TIGR03803 family)